MLPLSARTNIALGLKKNGEQAIGRSRGGLTTKIHVLVDALGNPVELMLTPGQAHDLTCAEQLIGSADPDALLGDKALRRVTSIAAVSHEVRSHDLTFSRRHGTFLRLAARDSRPLAPIKIPDAVARKRQLTWLRSFRAILDVHQGSRRQRRKLY